jgi:hypothetical protein
MIKLSKASLGSDPELGAMRLTGATAINVYVCPLAIQMFPTTDPLVNV